MREEKSAVRSSDTMLKGIDGSNPLGFLAALGTLRVTSLVWPGRDVRMRWQRESGAWRPVLGYREEAGEDEIAEVVTTYCRTGRQDPEEDKLESAAAFPHFAFDRNTSKLEPARLREVAATARQSSTPGDRTFADFVAAVGSDGCVDDGYVQDTALRTMSGAGWQDFLGTMLTLAEDVEPEHVRSALFLPWAYSDPLKNHSMRWDPRDDKRHAYQWTDPTHSSERRTGGMWGANRLAIEGFVLMSTAPTGSGLQTTGFRDSGKREPQWRWPLWSGDLNVEVCASLLALPLLQKRDPPPDALRAMGIEEVFESRRIAVGYFRNFTPARAV